MRDDLLLSWAEIYARAEIYVGRKSAAGRGVSGYFRGIFEGKGAGRGRAKFSRRSGRSPRTDTDCGPNEPEHGANPA